MEQLTSEQLKEKIASGESFIVDYFATWCVLVKCCLLSWKEVEIS